MGHIRPEWTGAAAIIFACFMIPNLISHAGGWATLAERYRFQDTFTGKTWPSQRAQMRWMLGYNNCLTVGADQRGIYISIFLLFRIGHPPLYVPWNGISPSMKKMFFINYAELQLGREVAIPFRITRDLAGKLKGVAGTNWPHEVANQC